MEKPRGARLLHQLLVLYQRVALYLRLTSLLNGSQLTQHLLLGFVDACDT